MSHSLEEYHRHLEKFGPEMLLDTAATELPESELSQLKALVESYERTHERVKGRWQARAMRQDVRKCEHCGLDLPLSATRKRRYHPHCVKAAAREREAKDHAR